MPTKRKHAPSTYRCAKTGKEKPASEMLRFVLAPNNKVVVDIKGDLPAHNQLWLCAEKSVLKEAMDSDLFKKMFGEEASVPYGLLHQVSTQLVTRIQNWLALARKGGHVIVGQTKVEMVLSEGKAKLYLVANDASEPLAGEVLQWGLLSREELGQPLGRTFAVHVVVADPEFAERISQEMRRLAGFREKDAL